MGKKKIVVLTGSGISAESGIPTFRDTTDALWENYDVREVCAYRAWEANSAYVNKFYNMLRVKYKDCKPNKAHELVHKLEEEYDVTVVTQNVDNLHEQAGSTNVLHLHGELMKCCSEKDTENEDYWVNLPKDGFGESGLEIPEDELAGDGSLLRPYIVFFGEPVPNLLKAGEIISGADVLIVIGTSLSVNTAAVLVSMAYDVMKPLIIINPSEDVVDKLVIKNIPTIHIKKKASEGMEEVFDVLKTL